MGVEPTAPLDSCENPGLFTAGGSATRPLRACRRILSPPPVANRSCCAQDRTPWRRTPCWTKRASRPRGESYAARAPSFGDRQAPLDMARPRTLPEGGSHVGGTRRIPTPVSGGTWRAENVCFGRTRVAGHDEDTDGCARSVRRSFLRGSKRARTDGRWEETTEAITDSCRYRQCFATHAATIFMARFVSPYRNSKTVAIVAATAHTAAVSGSDTLTTTA